MPSPKESRSFLKPPWPKGLRFLCIWLLSASTARSLLSGTRTELDRNYKHTFSLSTLTGLASISQSTQCSLIPEGKPLECSFDALKSRSFSGSIVCHKRSGRADANDIERAINHFITRARSFGRAFFVSVGKGMAYITDSTGVAFELPVAAKKKVREKV